MLRILTLIAGLAGATGLSQFPEFSQQYLQRLAGAVDELAKVVADFDASAEGVGLTRDQALASLSGGEFQRARREDMRRTIDRSERLSADLAALREATAVQRALQPARFMDSEIAAAAWEDFKPAVPVTTEGLGFAGVGFGAGALLSWPFLWLLRWPFRRAPAPRPAPRTNPPPLTSAPAGHGPRPALPLGWLARTNSEMHKVVQVGATSQIAVMSVAPGAQITGQAAPGGDLVLIAADGAGEICALGQTRTIEAGQAVSLPPQSSYEISATSEAALRLMVVEPRSALSAHDDPSLASRA